MKLDRRRKYFIVLDCETATLPFAIEYDAKAKKKIAIAKPLIYDLGWQIIDKKGNVYKRASYLITEIFSVPAVFNTAYYASKRPQYLEKLNNGEIILTDWNSAIAELIEDMKVVDSIGAYNSMFDFKKAIPFTEEYINNLYSKHYYDWESRQRKVCNDIAENVKFKSEKTFEPNSFTLRGLTVPLFDIWGLGCKHIMDTDDYREMALENSWITESGKYYKSSAETCYRFIKGDNDFIESHTAIEDAEIESEILSIIFKKNKNKIEMGIMYFPFRMIGKIE